MNTSSFGEFDRAEERINETAEKVESAMRETVSATKDKVMRSGQAVKSYLEDRRAPAANALDRTASQLREKSSNGMSAVCDVSDRASEKLERAANYLRTHDTDAMMTDTREFVKRNSGTALVVAIAVGFLLGRKFYTTREG